MSLKKSPSNTSKLTLGVFRRTNKCFLLKIKKIATGMFMIRRNIKTPKKTATAASSIFGLLGTKPTI
jgi:hypothetical protein